MSEIKVTNVVDAGAEEVSKSPEGEGGRERKDSEEVEPSSPGIEFKPIVSLPVVDSKTLEEEEDELLKLRAKLYRFENTEEPAEWKERGVGEVKFLKHKTTGDVRMLMRRDKTLKICANHYITPIMELKKHSNSDKAWVWSTFSDFADEKPKAETLCIRFGNPENAQKFQAAFEDARTKAKENMSNGLAEQLCGVDLNESNGADDGESESDSDSEGDQSSVAETKENHKPEAEKENEKPEADQQTDSK